jgi:hypothetical protein
VTKEEEDREEREAHQAMLAELVRLNGLIVELTRRIDRFVIRGEDEKR